VRFRFSCPGETRERPFRRGLQQLDTRRVPTLGLVLVAPHAQRTSEAGALAGRAVARAREQRALGLDVIAGAAFVVTSPWLSSSLRMSQLMASGRLPIARSCAMG